MQLRGVVLVEGTSDRRAVETLARRRGRDLQAESVAVVPMGGYGNLPRFLRQYRDVRLAGLYDVGEERHFLRALGCDGRGELERAGFYACTRDLEDELARAVGPDGMERVLMAQGELRAFRTYQKQPAHRTRPLEEPANRQRLRLRSLLDELARAVAPDGMERVLVAQGELRAFRTYQKQPAHRTRPLEEQLHGFMWNRKQRYAVLLVEALDLARVPRPLDRVLTHF